MAITLPCRAIAAAILLTLVGAVKASADARFVSLTPVLSGRLHAEVEVTVGDDARIPRFEWVRKTAEGVDIAVAADLQEGFFGPEVQVRRLPLTIDGLDLGRYPLRLIDAEDPTRTLDQVDLDVVDTSPQLLPAHAFRQWPEDAGLLDPVWLLLDLPDDCPALTLQGFADTAERIFIRKEAGACPAVAGAPTLSAVRLGTMQAQDTLKQIHLPSSDDVADSQAGGVRVQVSNRLSKRVAGYWLDPTQSGQGVLIQLSQPDRIALSWMTFDADGLREWIVAEGIYTGTRATLSAVQASGGRFPGSTAQDAPVVEMNWGQIEIEFTDCNHAQMEWRSSAPAFSDGQLTLTKLAAAEGLECGGPPPSEALRPSWYQGPGSYFRLR